ncbi:MAG: deoxyribodipyrimidine photo-lyase [Phycisphaerales bacterium]
MCWCGATFEWPTTRPCITLRKSTRGVVCLAVISPGDWKRHDDAPAKIDLWLKSLAEMGESLAKLNIPLLVRAAETPDDGAGVVTQAARQTKADSVFANAEYEVNESRRDAAIAAACRDAGVKTEFFHDQVVLPPGDVRTKAGGPFSVFTPYKRAWLAEVERRGGVAVLGKPRKQETTGIASSRVPTLASFGYEPLPQSMTRPAGESAALWHFNTFCKDRLDRYQEDRDPPGIDGTSVLSPHLAVGAISPRTCIAAAAEENGGKLGAGKAGPSTWISELVWREFYRHIVVHFPRVSMGRAFKPATDRLAWSYNERLFEAWKQGRTGYPIVDAGMRQLAATGWMHNRVRMIVAMFLSKDLFIDWRWGERHFMRTLADGDLANNNGGWQWSASTGTDSVPYFRVYNPIAQSRTHDSDGKYIRAWVPELAKVPLADIHDPETIAGYKLDYPRPIVDRTKTRDRVVRAFKALSAAKT